MLIPVKESHEGTRQRQRQANEPATGVEADSIRNCGCQQAGLHTPGVEARTQFHRSEVVGSMIPSL